jgi:GH25 family lysozyme M1 (1,4-beta-N-acetylmuramidase)
MNVYSSSLETWYQNMKNLNSLKTKLFKLLKLLKINILVKNKYVLAGIFIPLALITILLGHSISKNWANNQNEVASSLTNNEIVQAASIKTPIPTATPTLTLSPSTKAPIEETPTPKPSTKDIEETKKPDYTPVKVLPKVIVADNTETFKQIDPEYKKANKSKAVAPVKIAKNPAPTAKTSKAKVPETSIVTNGVDVSHWQEKINWSAVKSDGIDFAIIKLGGRSIGSNGNIYMDNCFDYNVENALANGVKVGVYFFSQAITEKEAIEEASIVLEYIKYYKITYPIVFDWEGGANFRGSNANLTASQMAKIITAFCQTIKNKGYEPMVYGNQYSLVRKSLPLLNNKYKFWLAHYTHSIDKHSSYSGQYQMWQYTDGGSVAGISGSVDLNIAYFGYSAKKTTSSPLALNVPTKAFTLNQGSTTNLLSGVTATNTSGTNISKDVTVTIKDANKKKVSQTTAFKTPGIYSLLYSVTDFTGATKSEKGTLTIRENPVITLPTDLKNIRVSSLSTPDEILKSLLDNVTAVDNEGEDITSSIKVSGYQDAPIETACTITYSVTDSKKATATATTILWIKNVTSPSPQPSISNE